MISSWSYFIYVALKIPEHVFDAYFDVPISAEHLSRKGTLGSWGLYSFSIKAKQFSKGGILTDISTSSV